MEKEPEETCEVVLSNSCWQSHIQAEAIENCRDPNVTACVNSSYVPEGGTAITIDGKTLPVCSEETMKGVNNNYPTWKCKVTFTNYGVNQRCGI